MTMKKTLLLTTFALSLQSLFFMTKTHAETLETSQITAPFTLVHSQEEIIIEEEIIEEGPDGGIIIEEEIIEIGPDEEVVIEEEIIEIEPDEEIIVEEEIIEIEPDEEIIVEEEIIEEKTL